jgi:3-deoxy-D-manno-octulosonic-acid transferase
MALLFYRLLKLLLAPVIFGVLAYRVMRGREDRENFAERRGFASSPRPELMNGAPLVWMHGASVGEVVSTLPVLRALRERRPDLALLLTTGTTTGRKMLLKHVPNLPGTGPLVVQYVPLDLRGAVGRFMRHWRPTVSVFTESDFWPELMAHAPRPVLLNGRISNRSWPRYQRWMWFFKPLLRRFVMVLAQSEVDAERLRKLGAKSVEVSGNLKFDADPLPVDATQFEKFFAALNGRPVLVGASTHPGEEELLAQMHLQLKAQVPDLLTIVVPRHPHRGTQATNAVLRVTKAVKRRGLGEMPVLGGPRHTDSYVADSLGELGLWCRLAHVVLVGGSLVKHGGHNPLEPLKLGVPTVAGPYMYNFQDMLPALTQAGVLTIAPDVASLTKLVQDLLTVPGALPAARQKIHNIMPHLSGPSARAATAIELQLR